jgi:hypothetical protein
MAFIQKDAQVYWHGGITALLGTWVFFKGPSYFSVAQGAGSVFQRKTALEYDGRASVFNGLKFQAEMCHILKQLNRTQDDCAPTPEILYDICDRSPRLDYMVFEADIGGLQVSRWDAAFDTKKTSYYLYDCARLRDR